MNSESQGQILPKWNDLMRINTRELRSHVTIPIHRGGFLLQTHLNCRTLTAMALARATDLHADSLLSLSQAKVGCDFQIKLLSGPACEQLRDLGFCETLQVRKLADGRNLICSVCGTRLALSRELASQVMVAVA